MPVRPDASYFDDFPQLKVEELSSYQHTNFQHEYSGTAAATMCGHFEESEESTTYGLFEHSLVSSSKSTPFGRRDNNYADRMFEISAI